MLDPRGFGRSLRRSVIANQNAGIVKLHNASRQCSYISDRRVIIPATFSLVVTITRPSRETYVVRLASMLPSENWSAWR